MSQGFSVVADELGAGSQDMAYLQQNCQAIAEDVLAALTGMAGEAGHAGLGAALSAAARGGNHAFTGMWAAYGHTSQTLATSTSAPSRPLPTRSGRSSPMASAGRRGDERGPGGATG
jgi:hypothetical protein